MPFYPNIDHADHTNAEKALEQFCKLQNVKIENCQNYYNSMMEEERKRLTEDFSENALKIRSQPDKIIFTTPPRPVDLKSTVRNDTGNIAIELSSYYFSYFTYDSLYAYLDNDKLQFFSPKNNIPTAIIIQPKWKTNQFFEKATRKLQAMLPNKTINLVFKETQGSNDPFVLLPKSQIKHIDPFNTKRNVTAWKAKP